MQKHEWPIERTDALRKLWADGDSASVCARKLSVMFGITVSRNSVIGKVQRANLPTRMVEVRKRPVPYRRRPSAVVKFARPAAVTDADIPQEQRKQLVELTSAHCHWPVGDVGEPGFFFCGAPIHEENPYCLAHCLRAYRPEYAERNAA